MSPRKASMSRAAAREQRDAPAPAAADGLTAEDSAASAAAAPAFNAAAFADPLPVPDDNDPVVAELPVFLSAGAGDSLVVLQYPTRRLGSVAAEAAAGEVRVKPCTRFVETDVATAFPPAYHDVDKTERWGEFTHQTFGGSLQAAAGRYAVAVLHDGALHLNVVSDTAQLRPQFTHYNQQLADEREQTKSVLRDAKAASTSAVQNVRAVQMSAKTAGEQTVVSDVAEYYKEYLEEPFTEYAVHEADPALLRTEARGAIEIEAPSDNFNIAVE